MARAGTPGNTGTLMGNKWLRKRMGRVVVRVGRSGMVLGDGVRGLWWVKVGGREGWLVSTIL